MATSFSRDIKAYFSQGERDSMKDANHTGGFTVDLWSADDVKGNWDAIRRVIKDKEMPPGGWADDKITKFLKDFDAWKAGGYQP
jgi:hypothetical protein